MKGNRGFHSVAVPSILGDCAKQANTLNQNPRLYNGNHIPVRDWAGVPRLGLVEPLRDFQARKERGFH